MTENEKWAEYYRLMAQREHQMLGYLQSIAGLLQKLAATEHHRFGHASEQSPVSL